MLRNTMTEGTVGLWPSMSMGGDWIAVRDCENSKDVWFIASTPSITIGSGLAAIAVSKTIPSISTTAAVVKVNGANAIGLRSQ